MNHEPFSKQVGMKINRTWTLHGSLSGHHNAEQKRADMSLDKMNNRKPTKN